MNLVGPLVSNISHYKTQRVVFYFDNICMTWTTIEICVFTFLCYPGTLMYLRIVVLLYVFTLMYKINQIK